MTFCILPRRRKLRTITAINPDALVSMDVVRKAKTPKPIVPTVMRFVKNAPEWMSIKVPFGQLNGSRGVHHTTVITWVKAVGECLPDAYAPEMIPDVGELDELETFIGSKKTKFGSGQQ